MSKKKCFYCGFLNHDNSLFCEECGKKLEYTCPNCGYINRNATKFCVNCGKKFDVFKHSIDEVDVANSLENEDVSHKDDQEGIICSSCGTKNELGSLFCEGCGERLVQDSKENDAEEEEETSDESISIDEDSIEKAELISEEEEETVSEEEAEQEEEIVSEDFIVCSSCGTKNKLGSLFCEGCGERLVQDSKENDAEEEEETSDESISIDEDSIEKAELISEEEEETVSEEEAEQEEEIVSEDFIVCSSCGTKNKLGSLFCEGCGERLVQDSKESDNEVEEETYDESTTIDEDSIEEADPISEEEEETVSEEEIDKETGEDSFVEESEMVIEEKTSELQNSSPDDEEEYVRVCGYCQTENPMSSLFCIGCGRKLIDDEDEEYVRVCGYCQTENPLSALFCEGCGKKLIDEGDDEEITESETNSNGENEEPAELNEEVVEEEETDEEIEPVGIDSEEEDIEEDHLEITNSEIEEDNEVENCHVLEKEITDLEQEDSDTNGIQEEQTSTLDEDSSEKNSEQENDEDIHQDSKLKSNIKISESPEAISSSKQQSKKKKVILLILLFLLLIIAIGCYLLFFTDVFSQKKVEPKTEEKIELILVPNVVGEDINVAKKKLEEMSLKVRIDEESTDNLDDVGKIFEQDVADKEVEKGTLITLKAYVSNEKVKMISVIGSNVEEAVQRLEELGLKVMVKEEFSDQPIEIVTKQNVEADKEISKGSLVEITMSKGQEEDTGENSNKDKDESNNNSSKDNNSSDNESDGSSNDTPVSSEDHAWSDWVDTLPSEVNQNTYQIEEKTVYRYRTTETMESDQTSMPGWNLSHITTITKGWSDVQRIPDVSDEQLAAYRNDSNYQILSEVKAYYKIDAVHCDKVSGEKGTVLPSSDGTCPSGYKLHENWTTSPTSKNIGTVVTTVCGQPNLTVQSTVTKSSLMWTIQVRTKVIENTYHYTRLTDWSAWQDEKVDTTDNRQVETKKMYRYREK